MERTAMALLAAILTAFLHGWMLMLGIGALHSMYPNHVPAVGYWTAVGVMAGIQALNVGKVGKQPTTYPIPSCPLAGGIRERK